MHPVRFSRRILATAVAAALVPAVALADPTSEELLQLIEELNQKVLVLERKLEVQDEATKTAVASTPVVKASPRGFSIASADSKNQIKLRGVLHFDGRFFESDDPGRAVGHLAGHPRTPHRRRHGGRHLRLPLHARLRPGPHGDPGRLRHGPLRSRRSR